MVGLVLFTYLISEMDLANPLGKDYSMLIVHSVSRLLIEKGKIQSYSKYLRK
ncbi:hypothetical protein Hanom_Chr01g00003861 [Helianthus anomalus]